MAAKAEKSSGLSDMFNLESVGEFLVKSILFGGAIFLLGGVVDFTLFHNHPLGAEIISWVNEPLMQVYDWIANTAGMEHLARPEFMLDAAGAACAAAIDPTSGLPLACT